MHAGAAARPGRGAAAGATRAGTGAEFGAVTARVVADALVGRDPPERGGAVRRWRRLPRAGRATRAGGGRRSGELVTRWRCAAAAAGIAPARTGAEVALGRTASPSAGDAGRRSGV